MKNLAIIILITFATKGFSQDRTCYVVYNHSENNKKIYIDEVPTNELNRYKTDHLNGNIEKTRGWFVNKQRLYKKDFAELKDNIDSKLDADYFIISLVSNIDLPKGYELILAPHLERYKNEIKDAINRKKYSNVGTEFNRVQGNTGTQMFLKEYDYLLKDGTYSDKVSEVVVQAFDADRTIAKVDFVATSKSGELVFIEVKTGDATLTSNQQVIYSRACSEGVILKSNKEIKGYPKGSKIKPSKVLLYKDNTFKELYSQ